MINSWEESYYWILLDGEENMLFIGRVENHRVFKDSAQVLFILIFLAPGREHGTC